jgi:hypothetical protein
MVTSGFDSLFKPLLWIVFFEPRVAPDSAPGLADRRPAGGQAVARQARYRFAASAGSTESCCRAANQAAGEKRCAGSIVRRQNGAGIPRAVNRNAIF